MNTSRLPWRVAGVVLVGIGMVLFDPDAPSLLQRLYLPVLFGLAAGLITQNLLAVALTGLLLSGIHLDLNSDHWIDSRAYPGIAIICLVALIAVWLRRLRMRIRDTHDDRWRTR